MVFLKVPNLPKRIDFSALSSFKAWAKSLTMYGKTFTFKLSVIVVSVGLAMVGLRIVFFFLAKVGLAIV